MGNLIHSQQFREKAVVAGPPINMIRIEFRTRRRAGVDRKIQRVNVSLVCELGAQGHKAADTAAHVEHVPHGLWLQGDTYPQLPDQRHPSSRAPQGARQIEHPQSAEE